MTEERVYDLEQALEQVIEEVTTEYQEHNWWDGEDEGELLHEIADSACPVMTVTIPQWATDNWDLVLREPEYAAFDGSNCPLNLIAANIYDTLYEEAQATLEHLQEETENTEDKED